MGLEKIIMEEVKGRKRRGVEMAVFISDVHIPYHDRKALTVTNKFLDLYQPEKIILGGDIMDMYNVSRFDKNPMRSFDLQWEFDEAKKVVEDIRKRNPKARIIMLPGNHEDRLQKYLWKNPEICGMRALGVPYQLGLKEMGIEWKKEFTHKGVLFTHGDFATKYTANKNLEVHGMNGVSGHKHTQQTIVRTNRHGKATWLSVGHLADVSKAEYVNNPDWQQGFGAVYWKGRGVSMEHVNIDKGKILYAGREFKC
jgi:UDP-2,3-diacylglucosamine pyrophosphatase LpxH